MHPFYARSAGNTLKKISDRKASVFETAENLEQGYGQSWTWTSSLIPQGVEVQVQPQNCSSDDSRG